MGTSDLKETPSYGTPNEVVAMVLSSKSSESTILPLDTEDTLAENSDTSTSNGVVGEDTIPSSSSDSPTTTVAEVTATTSAEMIRRRNTRESSAVSPSRTTRRNTGQPGAYSMSPPLHTDQDESETEGTIAELSLREVILEDAAMHTAQIVEDVDLEAEVRERILEDAVEAKVEHWNKKKCCALAVLLTTLVGIIVGATVGLTKGNGIGRSRTRAATLT